MGSAAERVLDQGTGACPLIGLIDDEPDLVAMSRAYLERDGFRVLDAGDATSGLAALRREPVDLVVLDLGLPDGNGLDLLRTVRSTSQVPIIIVTGRSGETDRVVGLELGADDYLVKPFSQRELVARIRAVLRRSHPEQPPSVIRVGALLIDTAAREIRTAANPIALTPREYRLLAFLAASPGQTFSAEQLLEHVWDSSQQWQVPSTVAEHVYRVRRKLLAHDVSAPRITTVRGFGYRLDL
ncbi:MAG TPA: response regulator transcription factor [Pseudonocardiaceae bacterium]|nr:response regulator transcription factor [Pseudonocardiaceae bacterium]